MATMALGPTQISVRRQIGLLSVLAAMLLTLAGASGVAAGRGDVVDPAFMTPALNPDFDWQCWRAAERIICEGETTDSYTVEEPGACNGAPLYISGIDSRRIRRVSDLEGRALTSGLWVTIRDRMSLAPTFDGIVAQGRGQFFVSFEWAVPGEQSTRTSILHGMDGSMVIPGQGMVLHQVGVLSYDINDNLLFAHGVHPIADDPDAAFQGACDALAGA